jgi:DNA-directed RNA polymerase subunit E'/Rpb7
MSKSLKSITKTSKPKQKIQSPNKEKSVESTDSDSIMSESQVKDINLNEIIYPCKDDDNLHTNVILYPYQMNNDLYINLKKNLIDKVEEKCVENCYIIKVYKIINYSNGIIEPENFTGSAKYNVRYMAKKCMAIQGTFIIAKMSVYKSNVNFAIAKFGNIINIVIQKNEKDINVNNFMISNDKNLVHKSSLKKLNVDDFVKVQLKSVRLFKDETSINCIGYLDDLATPEEIEKFGYKAEIKMLDDIANAKVESTIYYNEDNEIEEHNIEKADVIQTLNKKDNFSEI